MFLEANVYFYVYPENKNPLQTVDLQGVERVEVPGFESGLVFFSSKNEFRNCEITRLAWVRIAQRRKVISRKRNGKRVLLCVLMIQEI